MMTTMTNFASKKNNLMLTEEQPSRPSKQVSGALNSNYDYGIPLQTDLPHSAKNLAKPPLTSSNSNFFARQNPEALAETMARKKHLIEQAMLR
jgi:hypothetical protein